MDEPIGLIPLRDPGHGKTRLAGLLSTTERAALAGAMLADVVAALRGAELGHLIALIDGEGAAAAAAALGVEPMADPSGARGLDAAVESAVSRIGRDRPALVVMGDLPRLSSHEVETLLASSVPVVVAPTVDGGTGALLRRPGDVIASAYGRGSADRHLSLARQAGVESEVVHAPGFAHDVDTPADLLALLQGEVGPATKILVDRLRPRLSDSPSHVAGSA